MPVISESPLTSIGHEVATKRYFKKDNEGNINEDWQALANRVVNHVCDHENTNYKELIFNLIYETKFLPNSPCLVNSGTSIGGLIACFVTKSPEDSWVGMMENLGNFGHIARRGGGCGVDFSTIRPEGDPVFGSTHASACGPIKHMIVVSEAMNSITQAGFRGMANMGVLRVDHPDIEKFVVCKQHKFALKYMLREDIGGHYDQLTKDGEPSINQHAKILLDRFLSNFNISVLATDEFMKAVKSGEDFTLCYNGKNYADINARELFDKIIHNAWKNGDPGLLFYNTINDGPYKYSGQEITATNPCVTGDSLVPNEYGWSEVRYLKKGDRIFSGGHLVEITEIEKNENHNVFRVEFTDGDYVDVTAAHRFKCVVGKQYHYLRLDEIGEGYKVVVEPVDINQMQNHYSSSTVNVSGIAWKLRDLGLLLGTVLGDGCFTDRKSNRNMIDVSFGKAESDWRAAYCELLDTYGITYYKETTDSSVRVRSNYLIDILQGHLGLQRNKAPSKTIPEFVMNSNDRHLLAGVMDGLFSTDGSMYLKKDNPMLRFTSSSYEMCRQVRRVLLSFGIHAKIYKTNRKPHIYNDPKYGAREISSENPKYDVVLMNVGIKKFATEIVLTHPQKNCKLQKCASSYHYIGDSGTSTIKSITELPGLHTVYDLYALATDEWNVNGYVQKGCGEQALPFFGSCNLGSIDVSKFFLEDTVDVDWDSLYQSIRVSFQFLDNVIDKNVFPTPEFDKWAKRNRPVGLGIMGFADLLLKMKIRYGSDESIEFASKLAEFFKDTAHQKSVELGQERGTPACAQNIELEFRRNVTILSVAPTGSISLLAGCSSSIEPIFAPTVFRSDNTGNYVLPHPHKDEEFFACALDSEQKSREVTWQGHIRMQATFQKHVDSGISKTINMPSTSTVKDVADAYMLAWESGCKGITVYRDGSKSIQVLSTEKASFSDRPRRPKSVKCDIHKTKANGKEWHIIIGTINDKPYEVFAVNGRIKLPNHGIVIKRQNRHYSLLNENNVLIDNLNDEEELIDEKLGIETRRFSLELRHKIPVKFIVQQIDKSNENLTSFSKAVSRILKKKYMTEEDQISITNVKCPYATGDEECQIIYESGCWTCTTHSYSKCG